MPPEKKGGQKYSTLLLYYYYFNRDREGLDLDLLTLHHFT